MKCIIPCAGRGARLASNIPKVLIPICGKPVLHYIIDTWKDIADEFIFIIGYQHEMVERQLPSGAVTVIQEPLKGLADAILKAESALFGDRFIVNLGDCLFKGEFEESRFELGVGVWGTHDLEEIKKNYLVSTSLATGLIRKVREKPSLQLSRGNCGMGVYFLDKRVFGYIRRYEGEPGGGDFTEVLQTMIDNGEEVAPVWFKGDYVNINTPEDVEKAERLFR